MKSIQTKIKRVSFYFRCLFTFLLMAIPLIYALTWIYAPSPFDVSGDLGFFINVVPKGLQILHPLALSTKIIGFLIGAVPVIIIEGILYFLICLFKLYERSEVFSLQNVSYIKKIGYALLITQIVSVICNGIISVVLTWHNPHGLRTLMLTVTGTNISMILTAFIIILISWIMAEGCRLREEQQLTI